MLKTLARLMPNGFGTQRLEREKERLVAKLAEREALLTSLLESSPAGLIVATRDGEMRFASAKWSATVGYSQEELTGTMTRGLYADPNDREPALGALERDGKLRDYECRFRRRDGNEFWGVLNSSFVEIGGERLLATWVQDVSERHDAALALAAANEERNAMFEATTAGIALVKDRYILRCNRRLEELFGYGPGEMLDRPTRIMYASDEEAAKGGGEVYERIWRGETDRREQQMVRKDGSLFWCRLRGRAVDRNDQSKGTVWLLEDVTEERAASEALARALEDLKAIYESSPHGMGVARERRFIHVNSSLERMLGYEPGEMLGQLTRVMYESEDVYRDAGERLYPTLRAGKVWAEEFKLVRKDGSRFWCRITAAAMNRADPFLGTLGIYEDVTEIREATEALARALEGQKAILDTSPHGIAVTHDRLFVQTNASFERMFGYQPGELEGRSARAIYESEDEFHAVGARAYAALQRGEPFIEEELRLVRKDGTRFWARLTAAAMNRSDPLKGTLGIYEDVTEARQAAEALRQALDRQEKIFQASPYGIATYSDRTFVLASPAMERMFGYDPSEMCGKSSRILHDTREDFERAGHDIYDQLRSGRPMYLEENWLKRKDGSHFWVRVTLVALDRDDPIRSVLGIYEDITERKAAERALQAANDEQKAAAEALRQALDRQERIFEASPHGIATFEHRRFVLTSPALERMFGYGPGEMRGRSTRTILINDETYERLGREVYDTLRAGAPVHVQETLMERKDGSKFWGRVTAAALDPQEPLRGIVAIYEDITDRRAAEQALQAANDEQRAAAEALRQALDRQERIFQASPHGIATFAQRRIVIASPAFERMFGYEPGELLGKSSRVLQSSDEEYERVGIDTYAALRRGEHVHVQEKEFVRKDGSTFWARRTAAALDLNDPLRGILAIYEDITERKAAERALQAAIDEQRAGAEALRQALERQERIFEASPHGIATFEQRRFVLASPALERMLGYAPGELQGKPARLLYTSDGEYEQVGHDIYGRLRTGDPVYVLETQFVRKDGSLFWARVTAAALDRDDPLRGIVAVYEDITERKAAERALHAAKQAAEEATQAKSMFLANMSHE
ncbi:MAG: PAS domain S-box protein, partial [Burkholderiales bacterium]